MPADSNNLAPHPDRFRRLAALWRKVLMRDITPGTVLCRLVVEYLSNRPGHLHVEARAADIGFSVWASDSDQNPGGVEIERTTHPYDWRALAAILLERRPCTRFIYDHDWSI